MIKNNLNITNYYFRYALSVSLAIFFSTFLDKYYSYSGAYWITLSAFLVNISTRGAPFRQGLQVMMVLASAVILPALLFLIIPSLWFVLFITTGLMILLGWKIYVNKTEHTESFIIYVMFAIVWLLSVNAGHAPTYLWREHVIDILMGGLVGMFFALYVLPVKFFEEFSQGLIPLLKTMRNVMQKVSNNLNHPSETRKEDYILKGIVCDTRRYPEWVYMGGFNPGLRAGFRYFLVHLDYLVELCFSLNELTQRLGDEEVPDSLKQAFQAVLHQNNDILQIIIDRFESNASLKTDADFITDVNEMHEQLKLISPSQLELLEFEPHKIVFSAISRDLKDFRDIAMKLVMALPT